MATNHDNTVTKRAKASGKNLLTDTAIKGTISRTNSPCLKPLA